MPDWVFHRDDKLTEAEVLPRLIADFPDFRPRWEKHLDFWKGKPTGSYNDIAEFGRVARSSTDVCFPFKALGAPLWRFVQGRV
jgi:hypothetical protein